MRPTVALSSLLLVGCATGGGSSSLRHLTGQPYALDERADRLDGRVCGDDLVYQIEPRAGGASLSGFIDGEMPSELTIERRGDERHIVGYLGRAAGGSAVDLRLGPARLEGRVGFRRLRLVAAGDAYVGPIEITGSERPVEGVVQGRSNLAHLDDAATAALLPHLLTCYLAPLGGLQYASPLVVTVGGPPHDAPRRTSSLYPRARF